MFLVCGEALYDIFFDLKRSPANFNMNACAGGSPFNVAVGLARLGQSAALLTGVSTDELGNGLVQLLQNESVSTDYLIRSSRPTTLSLVGVDEAGQPEYTFYGVNSADCGVSREDLPAIGNDIVGLHFGSYSLVVKPVADAFASLIEKAEDRFISVDPNIRPSIQPDMKVWQQRVAHYASHADLLKISAEDMGYLYSDVAQEKMVETWLHMGVQLVVITDGGSEVRAWTENGHQYKMQPPSCRVIDTVGAGDTFQAALLMQLLRLGAPRKSLSELNEQGLHDLIDFAARAAAITCSRTGPDLPRLDDFS